MFTLEADDVIEEMTKVVAELGEDFVYQQELGTCVYYPTDGNPKGCIVGAVLSELDIEPTEDLISAVPWLCVLEDRGVVTEVTPAAKIALGVAQALQDTGETWGAALKAARAVVDVYAQL